MLLLLALLVAPLTGYLERRADGTCWAAKTQADKLEQVDCRAPMGSADRGPVEAAPSGGYLEKDVATGVCFWSLHAPYECPKHATCKPNPPVRRVACPK